MPTGASLGYVDLPPEDPQVVVLRDEVMHALASCTILHVHVPSALFTLGTCQHSVECLKAACKKCDGEFANARIPRRKL